MFRKSGPRKKRCPLKKSPTNKSKNPKDANHRKRQDNKK